MSDQAYGNLHEFGRPPPFRNWLRGALRVASIHNGSNATHIFYNIASVVVASLLATLITFVAGRMTDSSGAEEAARIALEHRLTAIEDSQKATNGRLDTIDHRLDQMNRGGKP